MSLTSTTDPSTAGLLGFAGAIGNGSIIVSYPMAASASVSAGDWVKLSSTTAGTIVKCSATSDVPIGVAYTTIDNTSGSAGDKACPVFRKGFITLDAVVNASGNNGAIINFDDVLYLTDSNNSVGTTAMGQCLSSTSTGNGTLVVAKAMDRVSIPTTSACYRIRVYMDMLSYLLAL